MIAEAGATIVTNFSSNLHLHSGIGPIASAHARGCAIAVGVDGVALDEDDDALREMRLVQMAHGGMGFERSWSRAAFLQLAVRNGRRSTGAPGNGTLEVGAPADFVSIDLAALDRDSIMEVDPLDLLFARAATPAWSATSSSPGGQSSGTARPTGVDLPLMEAELRRQFRAALPRHKAFLEAWPELSQAVRGWFESQGCC